MKLDSGDPKNSPERAAERALDAAYQQARGLKPIVPAGAIQQPPQDNSALEAIGRMQQEQLRRSKIGPSFDLYQLGDA